MYTFSCESGHSFTAFKTYIFHKIIHKLYTYLTYIYVQARPWTDGTDKGHVACEYRVCEDESLPYPGRIRTKRLAYTATINHSFDLPFSISLSSFRSFYLPFIIFHALLMSFFLSLSNHMYSLFYSTTKLTIMT